MIQVEDGLKITRKCECGVLPCDWSIQSEVVGETHFYLVQCLCCEAKSITGTSAEDVRRFWNSGILATMGKTINPNWHVYGGKPLDPCPNCGSKIYTDTIQKLSGVDRWVFQCPWCEAKGPSGVTPTAAADLWCLEAKKGPKSWQVATMKTKPEESQAPGVAEPTRSQAQWHMDRFPPFNQYWSPELKSQWFTAFTEMIKLLQK